MVVHFHDAHGAGRYRAVQLRQCQVSSLLGRVWWWPFTFAFVGSTALLIVRFLFGVGEAGAYPNITRALHNWFPARSWHRSGIDLVLRPADGGSDTADLDAAGRALGTAVAVRVCGVRHSRCIMVRGICACGSATGRNSIRVSMRPNGT